MGAILYFSLIMCATTWSLASALILKQATTKPRHTKFSASTTEETSPLSTPASSSASKDDSGVAYYRMFNIKSGATCILLKTDAVVEVRFKLHELDEQADSFIPEKALIEGDCKDEDVALMRISWTGYSMIINFAKTPGGERWYISSIELSVSPDLPQFHGIPIQRKSSIKLYHRKMLIPTPVGKSYSCSEVEVPLETDEEDNPPPGIHGTLFLRLLQVQAFMYRSESFDTSFECKPQMLYRDETAPIAVGSTLAVAVLLTIIGYAAYRYFKFSRS